MRYFIASDIHGSAYWCRRMLDAFEKSGADRLVLLGDILYHGPRNDLPDEVEIRGFRFRGQGGEDCQITCKGKNGKVKTER